MRIAGQRCPTATVPSFMVLFVPQRMFLLIFIYLNITLLLPIFKSGLSLASASFDGLGLPGFYFVPPTSPLSHSTCTPKSNRASLPQLSLRHSHGNTIKNSCNTNIKTRNYYNRPHYTQHCNNQCTPVSLTLCICNNNNPLTRESSFEPNPYDPRESQSESPLHIPNQPPTNPNDGNEGESIEENSLQSDVPPSFDIECGNSKVYKVNPRRNKDWEPRL